jgi:hypothetical protein
VTPSREVSELQTAHPDTHNDEARRAYMRAWRRAAALA